MFSTFYPFKRLPVDIRLCIWEQALRCADRGGGLHYFSVVLEPFSEEEEDEDEECEEDEEEDSHMGSNRRGLFERDSDQGHTVLHIGALGAGPLATPQDNKSVYLWDYGLWAACAESRNVIEKYYKRNRQLTPDCRPEWRDYHAEYPIFKTVWAGDQPLRVMLQPYKDIFCLGYEDLDTALLRASDPLGSLFLEPAEQPGMADLDLNLALVFHPSWRLDWPTSPEALGEEDSPRGALARLIEKTFVELWSISIWLIDRDAVPSPAVQKGPVFHDMETEYFKMQSGSEAFAFIRKLDTLLAPMYDVWTGVEPGQAQNGTIIPKVSLDNYVHVLGCRKYGKGVLGR
ncbi:hypothetical protein E4U43_000945 [Claviceps pusilla]|uniref:Uncharacterized protein n=1 Tax=Claviceps pusilla TaxID=123648 RepID=A0A9P7SZL2_9HYPO|nr:hypothetical protein E4U43_000945 [Claviceps pusilla]